MKCIKKLSMFIILYFVFSFSNVYAEDLPERFDLREHIDIEIRNQEETNTCWAFSATSLLSTHLAYLHDEIYTFSPRHLEYTMSEDAFTDSENKYAYETKTLDIGGNEEVVKQYYLQGMGPILEKYMPFENNSEPISIEELPLDLTYKQVTNVAHIFPMYKEWDDGELVYRDYRGNVIEQEAVTEYKNSVKTAIKEYGGIEAVIAFDSAGFNHTTGSFNTKEYGDYWHSVLLIGWDDGYSKENFKESVSPLTDGAYIALNSWGAALGDHGYMYISYEDISIDSITKTYIKEIQDVDYDNVYYDDLSVAKEKGETLTEISVAMDSAITGYTYVSLKVDGNYVLKYEVFDDSIENYVLETPVTLNNNSEVELEILVDEQYKQYFYPYYYTITNESQFESGKLNKNILDGNSDEICFYTKHNAIDNGQAVEVTLFRNGEDMTSKFNISGNNIKSNQTNISISSNDAYNGEYVMKLIYNNQEITHEFSVINGLQYVEKNEDDDKTGENERK